MAFDTSFAQSEYAIIPDPPYAAIRIVLAFAVAVFTFYYFVTWWPLLLWLFLCTCFHSGLHVWWNKHYRRQIAAILRRGYADSKKQYLKIIPEACPVCCCPDAELVESHKHIGHDNWWTGGSFCEITKVFKCKSRGHIWKLILNSQPCSDDHILGYVREQKNFRATSPFIKFEERQLFPELDVRLRYPSKNLPRV